MTNPLRVVGAALQRRFTFIAALACSLTAAALRAANLGLIQPVIEFVFSGMKNFLRVVRVTLQRRFTFVAAVACSIGVAVLWGANLGLIKPVIEIVFADKPPHAWADDRVAEAHAKVRKSQDEIDQIDGDL